MTFNFEDIKDFDEEHLSILFESKTRKELLIFIKTCLDLIKLTEDKCKLLKEICEIRKEQVEIMNPLTRASQKF